MGWIGKGVPGTRAWARGGSESGAGSLVEEEETPGLT
jgi:hypothetical protein